MYLPWVKTKAKVTGIFQPDIPYNPLIENGDSSPYFGTYEGQKYGSFDTDDCWDFSACEIAETRLEMFWKMNLIPQDTKDWLIQNRYIDSDGDFYLSRRWVAILSGVRDDGNDPLDFWRIARTAGLIPNHMLPYSSAQAAKWITKDKFNNEYFNPQAITKEMELMGKEFARRFNIQAKNIGGGYLNDVSVKLQTYLKEGSVQISIPVPQDGSWNTRDIKYPTGRTVLDHAVEGYKFDQSNAFPYFIYDSYQPNLKQLEGNYYIGQITRVSIIPNKIVDSIPVPPPSVWERFWRNAVAWLTGQAFPYPSVQLG